MKLTYEVTVHLDFDDHTWLHEVDESVTRESTILKNVQNIAETIESAVYDEYGRPYVTVSARFVVSKEE